MLAYLRIFPAKFENLRTNPGYLTEASLRPLLVNVTGHGQIYATTPQRIEAESGANIVPFVREVVEPGSVLRTDGAAIYRELREEYHHEELSSKLVYSGSGRI